MVSLPRFKKLYDTAGGLSAETKTGTILGITFFFALFLSLYFVIGPAVRGDYAVSGGSDAYYNMRIVQHILSTHHQMLFDPSLNYPIGLENPRPPFFMWLIVMLGYAFSPLLGGVYASTMTMFLASTALGGALLVFPTYYLGKELMGRKVGLIAAILVAMSPLTLMKSIASIGLFDIYTALFGLMFIYYFLRGVNTFKFDSSGDGLVKNIFNSIRANPLSVTYSLLAGVSLAASMLTWVGSISLVLILVGTALVQIIIYAMKRKEALPIFVVNLFFGSAFIVAFPWYYVAHFVPVRFEYPFLLWGALVISSMYFLLLRKRPWLISVGIYILAAAAAIVVLNTFDRNLIYAILSGQHYFIKNKIYDTIAEAQSLPLGEDMMEFGPFVFFSSFIGLAYLVYKWVKTATFSMTLAVLYFGGIIIISMIASKFLYFGATAGSILTGYIIVRAFELLSFKESVDKTRGRSIKTALRKEFKFAHYAVVLVVVFLLIIPTTFYAVDSAIPFNNKTFYDEQLYNSTPSFLKPYNYSAPYYLGAFGADLALPNAPLNKALSWFQNQDAQMPPNLRPAFMSWWDYGFQTLEQGNHPVMADNFQDGIYPAAQLLLAQNESQMIAVMISRMILNYTVNSNFNNSSAIPILYQYLGSQGASKIMSFVAKPDSYIPQIYADPSYYGHYESVQAGDAVYILLEHYLSNSYSLDLLINLYSALEQQMNKYMSYIAVDSGLFPFSGTNTGIFYAPSYLGDFPYVNASGEIIPSEFYNITVTDTTGSTYLLQNFPSGDTPVNYTINYTSAFYNTTIYRAFIGYSPKVVGASSGIPGISGSLKNYYPMQGWNLSNFELAYKTVLWNPYTDYRNHTAAWTTVSLEQGYAYLKEHYGTVDLNPPSSVLESDIIFLEYYPGAIIHGRVVDSNGTPVQGVRVTITDQYGIPHQTVLTNSTGYYSIYAVAGNDTVTYSSGAFNPLFMIGNSTLSTFNITITNSMANRESYDYYGQPTWNITHNVILNSYTINGILFLNLAGQKTYNSNSDMALSGTIQFYNSTYNTTYYVNTGKNGSYQLLNAKPYDYVVSAFTYGSWYNRITYANVTSSSVSKDVPINYGGVDLKFQNYTTPSSNSKVSFTISNFSTTYKLNSQSKIIYLAVGTYNVSALNGRYYDNFTYTVNNGTTANVTLSFAKYYNLTFKTEINGLAVSAPVQIYNGSPQGKFVFTNSQGIGTISTPAAALSIYTTVFYDGSYYTATQILNVSGPMVDTINLTPSYLVYGNYYIANASQIGPPIAQSNAEVTITGSNTFLVIATNSTGYFATYLPVGEYSFVAYDSVNSPSSVASSFVSVSNHSVYLGMLGSLGYVQRGNITYSGKVYSGIMTSEMYGRPYYDTFMGSNMGFTIHDKNGYGAGNLNFISPGFAVQSVSSLHIKLNALPIQISIYASYQGSYPLTAYVNGPYSYQVSGQHWFNLTLLPGNYSLIFKSQGLMVSSSLNRITVVAGEAEQSFYSNLSLSATLNIDPNGSVYVFKGGQLVSTSLSANLPTGMYTIYSYYGSTAALVSVNLTENTSVSLNMQSAYKVNLIPSVNSNVTIKSGDKILDWSGSILLPEGSYEFSVEQSYNTSFQYYAYSSYYISSSKNVYLNATLIEMLSSLYLNAYYKGGAITSGSFYIQGQRNVSGILSAGAPQLPYGPYSIYVTSGNLAYIGRFTVNASNSYLNVTLGRAYAFEYGTYLNNSSYKGDIAIGNTSNYYIPANGVLYLPNGSYTFTASASSLYYGNRVNYTLSKEVNITGASSATFVLGLDRIINVTLFPESGSPTLYPNQNITFPVVVKSESNVPLNFSIENASGFMVKGSTLNLRPYSTGIINVTIGVPAGEAARTASIGFRVFYDGTYKVLSTSITIPAMVNITFSASNSSGKVVGNLLEIPLAVKNNGNVKTGVTVTLVNAAQLSAKGVNVTFNGSNSFYASVEPLGNNSTYIVVNSTLHNVSGRVIYIMFSYGNESKVITVVTHLPTISVNSAKGTARGLTAFNSTVMDYYIYGFVAFIVLAMVAVMFIFRRRSRA